MQRKNEPYFIFNLENLQMIFSNESITKIREKKAPIQTNPTETMSKMSTSISITDTTCSPHIVDLENQEGPNHWFFGVQEKIYPYHLLKLILECLNILGFVTLHVIT